MTEESIQVLLSTYNGSAFLPKLLRSIENQSIKNFSILARDDGSFDQTKKLLLPYPTLESTKNIGIIQSFSTLIQKSSAPYIMLADQDDFWLPNKAEITLDAMKKAENVFGKDFPILIHTDLCVVNKQMQVIHPSFWSYSKLDPYKGATLSSTLAQNSATGCTMMMNQALKNLILPIPECTPMHDHWIALVAAAMGRTIVVKQPTILYRQHADNDTGAFQYNLQKIAKLVFSQRAKKQIRTHQKARFLQAKELIHRFKSTMSKEHLATCHAYLRFKQSHLLQRIQMANSWGFTRSGWLRTIGEILGKVP